MRLRPNLLTGVIVILAFGLGVSVFATLANEYRRTRNDLIELATTEARVVLDTVVVAIQTTAGIRMYLQGQGVATNVVQEVVRSFGTGRLLQKLARSSEFSYIVCQDRERVIVATNITEISSIDSDPFLRQAMNANRFDTRVLPGAALTFEAVRPFVTDQQRYLLRVGVKLSSVQRLQRRTAMRLGLTGGVFGFVTFLLLMYLFNVYKTRLLARQRDRVTAEVERISQQLRQQERVAAMGTLAAVVAHEIRNPLNAIHILVQRLERETEPTGASAEKFTHFTRVIREEVKRVNTIIEQFLLFARAKPPELVRCNPLTVAHDVVMLERGIAQERGVTLKGEWPTEVKPVRADVEQLKQALVNLVQNALEATPQGGEVLLSVQPDGAAVVFQVADTGCGMTADVRQKAFDLHFTTKAKGTGLGLAITRRIVEQHGGMIAVSENQPRGTTVRITIPAWTEDEHPGD